MMLHYFSTSFVQRILGSKKNTLDADSEEIYVYGMECFLHFLFSAGLLIAWGIYSSHLIETLVWMTSFLLLRQYVGGYHAPTALLCTVISTGLGISNSYLPHKWNEYFFIHSIVYFALLILFLVTSPVISPLKSISSEKRMLRKRFSCILLLAYTLIGLFPLKKYASSILYASLLTGLLAVLGLWRQKKQPV